ncbi:hypothetical protein [Ralstonia pseudosolanacearum]|uniref:Putative transmembrane protein n=1 Tax=Ralstonia solanacearum TaxID=305 RepID=A0A0S4WMQ1_RALSL|nr:hypothetical protein [Ralstonia pseudosolanacearum]CUV48091.1 putative transmembrane protein [Ralstonia solanacearum]MDO3522347.1 hypothetical protein [Ralstonia pseudosolanacearum]MDO3547044.1 hypothetical protein [Ralstonia pseudosolanacearum]MDO3552629.1 hypothetical protein [Ralstonia pseudosolanacearum]MDO3557121.1 hypothetical protein [Ralstonia pseudosolanacearum]
MSGIGTKWLAGATLGLPLAVALCALPVRWLPGGWETGAVGALLACVPLWVGILCASLLFATSRQAWTMLAAGNALAFGLLWAPRMIHA